MAKITFFPPFLDKGSFDDPEAGWGPVRFLQLLLVAFGYATRALLSDGVYGDETAASVVNLQRGLGLSRRDIDGNFGPVTRERLRSQTGLNVNSIPCPTDTLVVVVHVSPEYSRPTTWPGVRE